MLLDNNLNSGIKLHINNKLVSFNPEIDIKNLIIEPTNIQFRLTVPQVYEQSGLSISIGEDIGFKGFDILLKQGDSSDNYVATQEHLGLICGMRLIGRCSLTIKYFGEPIVGFSTFIWFEPQSILRNYVEIMRQSFDSDNQAILDIYGLTNEEFTFEEI